MSDAARIELRWGDEPALHKASTGAQSTVVLHSGPDERWLRLDAPERFGEWVALAASTMPSQRSWVTVDDLNGWPVSCYSPFGPRRTGRRWSATGHLLRALDHQLAAHAAAGASLPEGSEFGVGFVDHDPYELHRMLVDVLGAPAAGVDRRDIGTYLRDRRADYERATPALTPRRWVLRRLTASVVPLEQALPRAIASVYRSATRPEYA